MKSEKHNEMQFELSWTQLFEGQPPTTLDPVLETP